MVVFSPQIIENFRRRSADGLSLLFLGIWLAGDVFNILGAVFQSVLPTMIILAVYYTLADIVLLGQCLYYRGLLPFERYRRGLVPESGRDEEDATTTTTTGNRDSAAAEQSPLLHHEGDSQRRRRSFREHLSNVDGTHLSPAVPIIDPPHVDATTSLQHTARKSATPLQKVAFNMFAVALVFAAGVSGWYISSMVSTTSPEDHRRGRTETSLKFDFMGQVFGYLCTALYLGSRIPQLLLNYQRKSTEGISLLFFLFACLGNLTFVLSIFAFVPVCAEEQCAPGESRDIYLRYLVVNAPWLIGSLGNLLQDMFVFVQFVMYDKIEESHTSHETEVVADSDNP